MGLPMFGSNSKEVTNVSSNVSSNAGSGQSAKISVLQTEIAQAREKIQESEVNLLGLQKKLNEYLGKERQIAEVMITAQINAQRVEAEARAKAEVLLQDADEELRRKSQELELLRLKAHHFKKELYGRLDEYRSSLDQMAEISEDIAFTPTLISREKRVAKSGAAEIS